VKTPQTPGSGTFERSAQRKDASRRAVALNSAKLQRKNLERQRRRDKNETEVSSDEEILSSPAETAAKVLIAQRASFVKQGELLSTTLV
jgi:hypothetical protein